jgi:cyclic-di-GMP phosphodiesterase TipF (flagellum assembly factor)
MSAALLDAEREPEPEPEPIPEPVLEPEPEPEPEATKVEDAEETKAETPEPAEEPLLSDESLLEAETQEPEISAPAAAVFDDEDDAAEERMLGIIRKGIEEGRVGLHLQPTVTLPDRKVRYFEALTRIRTADDDTILPDDYMPVAKRSGLMPLIDNVLLVRSVQVLRRLGPDTRIKGVFANVSMHSLLDPDYYPELVEFMEENTGLSENLIFEISQAEMLGLTEAELGCLDTLGALGYTFSLDHVTDLETDFAGLSDRYFRHVKVSAASFLGGPGRKAADLKRHLDGLGVQLIIEKVENEGDVAELLDHGIEVAQGYLFGEPQPMNAALSKELENADAT